MITDPVATSALAMVLGSGDFKGQTLEGDLVIEVRLSPSDFDWLMEVSASDDEDDDPEEEIGDTEPSLGSFDGQISQQAAWRWHQGNNDLELDIADDEADYDNEINVWGQPLNDEATELRLNPLT